MELQIPSLIARCAGEELYGAPRFSLLDLIKIKENDLSTIIADLFNPRGMHGQGLLFLNSLLQAINLQTVGSRDVVNVKREFTTEHQRRIDIVLETKNFVYGIENKPWAGQSKDQLADYLKEIKRIAGERDSRLIFLSDQVEGSATGKILRLQYWSDAKGVSLYSILSGCISSIRANRTRVHVEELRTYIQEQFGKTQMKINSDEVFIEAAKNEYNAGDFRKKAVSTILLSYEHLHKAMIDELQSFIFKEMTERLGGDFVIVDNDNLYDCLVEKYSNWGVRRETWPENCTISLEAQADFFDKVIVGVWAPDLKRLRQPDAGYACSKRSVLDAVRRDVPGGSYGAWWPWSQRVTPPYLGPDIMARMIIDSPTAKLGDHPDIQVIASKFVELASAVDNALLIK